MDKKKEKRIIWALVVALIILILLFAIIIIITRDNDETYTEVNENEGSTDGVIEENIVEMQDEDNKDEKKEVKEIKVIETEDEFNEKVIVSGDKVIVDFYSERCLSCDEMDPVISELSNSGVLIYKVNLDNLKTRNVFAEQEVIGVPTYVYYNEGKEVYRDMGIVEKDAMLKKYNEL